LSTHSGEKHDWQHILGKKHGWQHILGKKNIIGSIFWEKKHDWQHILVNNMIGSTFWKKYIIGSKFCGKT
jgi:hypothetical protein